MSALARVLGRWLEDAGPRVTPLPLPVPDELAGIPFMKDPPNFGMGLVKLPRNLPIAIVVRR